MLGGEMMDTDIQTELRTLLRVIFDLRVPEDGDTTFQISRPKSLEISEWDWLSNLIDGIAAEMMMAFDLRLKTANDDPKEIESWKTPTFVDGQIERRKNYRLRIRTLVDDLFEESVPQARVSPTLRAWKIQITDACAEAVLTKFHVRPASSGPWAAYRRKLYDIGQKLQQALAHKDLFLLTGRVAEATSMKAMIEDASHDAGELMQSLKENEATDCA